MPDFCLKMSKGPPLLQLKGCFYLADSQACLRSAGAVENKRAAGPLIASVFRLLTADSGLAMDTPMNAATSSVNARTLEFGASCAIDEIADCLLQHPP
jgi:hypothetical protein